MPGIPELILVLLVIVLIFGAGKLPEVGAGLGKGIREFKDSISGLTGNGSLEDKARSATKGIEDNAKGFKREFDEAMSSDSTKARQSNSSDHTQE